MLSRKMDLSRLSYLSMLIEGTTLVMSSLEFSSSITDSRLCFLGMVAPREEVSPGIDKIELIDS